MKGFLAIAVVLVIFGNIHSQDFSQVSDCLSRRHSLTSNGNPPPGTFVPECEDTGYYKAKQCDDSGRCNCVSTTGQQISEQSRTLRSCHCLRRAHETQITNMQGQYMLGAYIPGCASDGLYEKVQCNGSTGFCWCADPESGEAISKQTRERPTCL